MDKLSNDDLDAAFDAVKEFLFRNIVSSNDFLQIHVINIFFCRNIQQGQSKQRARGPNLPSSQIY